MMPSKCADRAPSNELNASYAADGYARVKEGLGVLLTTYVLVVFHSMSEPDLTGLQIRRRRAVRA